MLSLETLSTYRRFILTILDAPGPSPYHGNGSERWLPPIPTGGPSMAVRALTPEPWDDQDYYPLHEEDDVPEIPPHRRRVTYLYNALTARFPDWFVTGNVCIYWQRGNT